MSIQVIKLISLLHKFNYKVYAQPFQVNIVGLRANSTQANKFDDVIHVFFRNESGKWIHEAYRATSDPGTFWLQNPSFPQGTAILAPGQYRDAYQLGLHRGQYTALVQKAPVKILRDYNRDAVLDFENGSEQNGLYGINIHRAAGQGTSKFVDKYSAGCQVIASAEDFGRLISYCKIHKQRHGNNFTYTLIDLRAINRRNMRYAAYTILACCATGIGMAAYQYKLGSD